MEISEEVVIVGAGIAGLATALALKRIGVRALVLERAHELRTTGVALSLTPNAWLALEALGVAYKLTSIYAPSKKGYVTDIANGGATQEVNYTGAQGNKSGPRTVHRRALLEALAEELPLDAIRFSSKLASIQTHTTDEGSSIAILRLDDDTVIKAKLLIGCDGVHSVVARWLGLSAAVNSGRSAVRGLAVFPRGHGFDQEVHQFINQDRRGGFVPLTDKEIYWFIVNKSGPAGEEIADHKLIQKDVIENLAKDFPPIYLEVVRHADLATLTWAPLMFRYPWDLIWGHLCKGNVTVAGDAMHPMTPDLGQGGGAALEDAVILGRHIGISIQQKGRLMPGEVAGVIENYVKDRKWRAVGLITGSYLSGWVQQGGSGWLKKFFRDAVFYRFIFPRIADAIHYNCGKLPSVSWPTESENQAKID